MGYYGSIGALPRDFEMYSNHCVDGKCVGCGECCADLLPVTDAELRRLKEYARRHQLREHRQAPFFDRSAVDFTCPFRNESEKKCDVYAVRPLICRSFICSKTLMNAKDDRDLLSQARPPRSLRWEIFGNSETVDAVAKVLLSATVRKE